MAFDRLPAALIIQHLRGSFRQNAFREHRRACCEIVNSGAFANKACQEAARYGKVNIVASSKDRTFSYIPKLDKSQFTPDADYFYICMNNTIYGTVYHELPDTGSVPLVADVSSCILYRTVLRMDCVVEHGGGDLLRIANQVLPDDHDGQARRPHIFLCARKEQAELRNVDRLGEDAGRDVCNQRHTRSKLFKGTVVPEDRSLMNAPFVTGDAELDKKFIAEADAAGFVSLKGHRSVGGMRASIYNAMPLEGVEKLVALMQKFF